MHVTHIHKQNTQMHKQNTHTEKVDDMSHNDGAEKRIYCSWLGGNSASFTSENNAKCAVIQRQTVKKEMGEDILNLPVPDTERVKTFVTFLFCLASSKTQCPAGFYSTGVAVTCSVCDYGYTCSIGATSATPPAEACAKGGWCDGKDFHACPAGTFNPYNGSASEVACVTCPAGRGL